MQTPISQYLKHELPDLKTIHRLSWFDNSTIESFQDCNRESWYNAFMGLSIKSPPMAAGSVWHAAMESWHNDKDESKANVALAREYQKYRGILENGPARIHFANLNNALHQYAVRYAHDQVQYHEQEFKFAVWMPGRHEFSSICKPGKCENAEGLQPDSCFYYVGRFDGIITYIGELALLENKTTGQLGASYQQGLEMSRQGRGYFYATRRILQANNYPGRPLKGVLFNTVRLTTEIDFNRFFALIHDGQIREWEDEIYDLVAQIRKSWTMDRKPNKNTRQCTRYGVCPFITLCQSWAGHPKDRVPGVMSNYKKEPWTPF